MTLLAEQTDVAEHPETAPDPYAEVAVDHWAEGKAELERKYHQLAFEHFATVADQLDHPRRLDAVGYLVELSLFMKHPHEALAWVERLRDLGGHQDQADLQEAVARLRIGEGAKAVKLIDKVLEPSTEEHQYPDRLIHVTRAEILAMVDRREEALDEALAAVRLDLSDADAWRVVGGLATHEDVEVDKIIDAIPADRVSEVVAQLTAVLRGGADTIAEGLWQRNPGDLNVLVLIAHIGSEVGSAERALEWSARMREYGIANDCPLLGIAAHPYHRADHRIRAAAIAGASFDDERARPLLELATTKLLDEDIPRMLEEMIELAPDYADSFVAAAANTPRRALIVAASLYKIGVVEIADAVARHGIALQEGDPRHLVKATASRYPAVRKIPCVAELLGH